MSLFDTPHISRMWVGGAARTAAKEATNEEDEEEVK